MVHRQFMLQSKHLYHVYNFYNTKCYKVSFDTQKDNEKYILYILQNYLIDLNIVMLYFCPSFEIESNELDSDDLTGLRANR